MIRTFLLVVLLGLVLGGIVGYFLQQKWVTFEAPDKSFTASFFETKPLQMAIPRNSKQVFAEDELLRVYSIRTPLGIDEINKFETLTTASADEDWFQYTLKETKGTLLSGTKEDFMIEMPEGIYLRGRILFAPNGQGLFKIFVLRKSLEELDYPSAVRFLYGIKF